MASTVDTIKITTQDGECVVPKHIASQFKMLADFYDDDEFGEKFDFPGISTSVLETIVDFYSYDFHYLEPPSENIKYTSWDDINVIDYIKNVLKKMEPEQLLHLTNGANYIGADKVQCLVDSVISVHLNLLSPKHYDMIFNIPQEVLDNITPEKEKEILDSDVRFQEETLKSDIKITNRPIPNNLTPPQKRKAIKKNEMELNMEIEPHQFHESYQLLISDINIPSFNRIFDYIDFHQYDDASDDVGDNAVAGAAAAAGGAGGD